MNIVFLTLAYPSSNQKNIFFDLQWRALNSLNWITSEEIDAWSDRDARKGQEIS